MDAMSPGGQQNPAGGGGMYAFLRCTAGEYMTHPVVSVTGRVTMRELQRLFERHDFNAFPVLEAGKMVGIVTKLDFLKMFAFTTGQMVPHYDELMQQTVSDVMSKTVVHVEPETPLTRVLQLMVSRMTRSLPVENQQGELVGMISREDVMRALGKATQS